MTTVKLVLNMRNTIGDSVKKTYPNINESATDAQYRTALEGLCSLTTNTFISAQKIVTTDLESTEP